MVGTTSPDTAVGAGSVKDKPKAAAPSGTPVVPSPDKAAEAGGETPGVTATAPVPDARQEAKTALQAQFKDAYLKAHPDDPDREQKVTDAVADLETPLESGDDKEEARTEALEKIFKAKEALGIGQGDFQKYFDGDDRWDAVASKQVEKAMERGMKEAAARGVLGSEAEAQEILKQGEERFVKLFSGDPGEKQAAAVDIAEGMGITTGEELRKALDFLGYQDDPSFYDDVIKYIDEKKKITDVSDPTPAPVDEKTAAEEAEDPIKKEAEEAETDGKKLVKEHPGEHASHEDLQKWYEKTWAYLKKHPVQRWGLYIAGAHVAAFILPSLLIFLLGIAASSS